MTSSGIYIASGRMEWRELVWFGKQQAFACIFGILLLSGLMLTKNWNPAEVISRSDILFLYAVSLQIALFAFRLEHKEEIFVILAFHVLATFMEWFKTSAAIGSWHYPDTNVVFQIYQVPMFAGFLYSAVGSYIARAWRLFDFRFEGYPPVWMTLLLAGLAYGNFFTHHYIWDIRWVLIAASVCLFARCRLHFRTGKKYRSMPILGGLAFVALAIYGAENIGTYAKAWAYPDQEAGWKPVSFQKFWAWYLLMLLSFVLVSLVHLRSISRDDKSTRIG